MGDSQAISPKYIIQAKLDVEGVVEKPDVIGALFGQTEGLFGPDLDLRELQKTGRIGRIEIKLESKQDRTYGTIIIPISLDKASTSLIAAIIESVDRVGPCAAKITLEKIDDEREQKRDDIVKRAQNILHGWTIDSLSTTEETLRKMIDTIKPVEVVNVGPENISAGPDALTSNSLILVEGRADVINLLKCGIRNVIAIEGAKIPEAIIKLIKENKDREITAFLDGDRGGDLILKELLQIADIDYIARAPKDKEVEDLSPKEIIKALKEKVPAKKVLEKKKVVQIDDNIKEVVDKLKGTLEAIILNEKLETINRVPVSELCKILKETEEAYTIVFDGVITQRLIDIAEEKGIKRIIGDRVSEITKRPVNTQLLTFSEITDS
jgi:DNA primase